MQHIHFLDSVSYLPMPLRKVPETFGLSTQKTWFSHYWNTEANLDYVGPIPDIKYFGADEMSENERISCLGIMSKKTVFDNRRALEQYCQDDVTVLRQACHIQARFYRDWKYRGLPRGSDNSVCME